MSATTQIQNVINAGTEQLSGHQTITFVKYYKFVLPLDGFVFWINAALVAASAVPPSGPLTPDDLTVPGATGIPITKTISGSFHYDIERRQIEDQTFDINRITLTSEQSVNDLDEVGPRCMFLGSFNDPRTGEGTVRFAFDKRKNFYQQANIYHYIGDAVYPDMEPQIIDTLDGFDSTSVVVSNSLPIWLAMDQSNSPYPYPSTTQIVLYPSFIVPDDIDPPYGVVHITPDETQAIAAAPLIVSATSSHYQLSRDKVKITFVGLRNNAVQDFTDYVAWMTGQYQAPFGVMNIPIPRDEKRNQDELSAIAMKKTVLYEVNYYQQRMRDVALQAITSVVPNFIIGA